MAWVKPVGDFKGGGWAGLVVNGDSTNHNGSSMVISNNTREINFFYAGTDSIVNGNTVLTDNAWSHVAAVYDSTTNKVTFYYNGNADGTSGSLGTWYGDTYVPMLIGKLEDINYYFNGSIDEVKVYKRALAAGQVRMIYENQTNKIHSSMTSAGENWSACVTPNDGFEDGSTLCTNNLTIGASNTYVNLTSPLDSWYVNNTVKFECTAYSNIPLINVSLWHNNTGTWHRNATVLTAATSAIIHSTVTGLATNNFVWACQVCDANHECFYANANRTLYVDVTNPDIEFHSSSVANNTKRATYYNNAYINTTITEASNNMSAFIDWNRSLVGYWRLENTNGTWFADSSTWGNNGTCTTTACPNLTTGMRGKAYRFDGSNDGISTVSTARSGSASMFAWIYQPSTAGTDCTGGRCEVIGLQSENFFEVHDGGVHVYGYGFNTPTWVDVTGVITANRWYHVGYTYNTTTLRIYVDGRDVGGNNAVPGVMYSAGSFNIGFASAGVQRYFNGSIDEVISWDRVLSPEEVNATYSAGVWKLYRNFTSLSSGTYTYKAYVVDRLAT